MKANVFFDMLQGFTHSTLDICQKKPWWYITDEQGRYLAITHKMMQRLDDKLARKIISKWIVSR